MAIFLTRQIILFLISMQVTMAKLEFQVWFCVIAAVALSGPLLYFFSRASPYYRTEEKPNYFASLSESYMYCYGAIVSQGTALYTSVPC